jgi:HEAT repeat protein
MKKLWLICGLCLPLISCVTLNSGPTIPIGSIPGDAGAEVRAAIEKLYSPDYRTRSQAAADLGEMGAKAISAVPFLVSMLGDWGSTSGSLGGARIEPAATRFLASLTPAGVRARASYTSRGLPPGDYAAEALRNIGTPALPALIAALRQERGTGPLERLDLRNAAWALGEIRDERAVEPLIDLLRSPLLRQESSFTVEGLALSLAWTAPVSAIEALGKIRDRRAVEPLVAMLEKKLVALKSAAPNEEILALDGVLVDNRIVLAAIEVLGSLGDPRAAEPLKGISRVSWFSEAAARAIVQLEVRSPH